MGIIFPHHLPCTLEKPKRKPRKPQENSPSDLNWDEPYLKEPVITAEPGVDRQRHWFLADGSEVYVR